MPSPTSFDYTIYIQATPERIWQALTDPEDTSRYWRHQKAGPKTFRSDWKEGSTWDLLHEDVGLVVSDPDQVILESDPPNRLVYRWHRVTPEWAAEVGMNEATAAKWRAEPLSRCPSTSRTSGTAWSSWPSSTTASKREARFSRGSPRDGLPSSPV